MAHYLRRLGDKWGRCESAARRVPGLTQFVEELDRALQVASNSYSANRPGKMQNVQAEPHENSNVVRKLKGDETRGPEVPILTYYVIDPATPFPTIREVRDRASVEAPAANSFDLWPCLFTVASLGSSDGGSVGDRAWIFD